MTARDRADPEVARRVIDSVFAGAPGAAKDSFRDFFSAGVQHLSAHHPAHWGVTLFDWGFRLNAGSVECLVLHAGGLRVNVMKESAPGDTRWDGVSYTLAPGCEFTTIPLRELPRLLPSFLKSHLAALSRAAERRPPGNICHAHSTGVTAFFSLPDPTYVVLMHPDEQPDPRCYSEGGRCAVLVNRFERDPRAREACISHYGARCSVCNMSFRERYGDGMEDFIHVHHVAPVSQMGAGYQVDPIVDLRPVCPNCHAAIHRCDPPLSVEEARVLLVR